MRGGGGGGGGGGGANDRSIGERCSECWNSIPYVSKNLMKLAILSFVLTIVGLGPILYNTPIYTVRKFQLWRLLTNIFVGGGVFTALFAMLWLFQSSRRLEMEKGSMYMIHAFAYVYLGGTLLFTIVGGSLMFVGGGFGSFFAKSVQAGLWGPIFGMEAVRCMGSSDPTTQLCCLPIQVPTKWYPLIIVTLFQLFGLGIANYCSLAIGYLYAYAPAGLEATMETLRRWEAGRFQSIAASEGFIAHDQAQANPQFNPFTIEGGDRSDQQERGSGGGGGFLGGMFGGGGATSGNNREGTRPFSGQGYTLGTRSDTEEEDARAPVEMKRVGRNMYEGVPSAETSIGVTDLPPKSNKSASALERQRRVMAERLENRLKKQQQDQRGEEKTTAGRKDKTESKRERIDTAPHFEGESSYHPDDSDLIGAVLVPEIAPPEEARPNDQRAIEFGLQHDVDITALVSRFGCSRKNALDALMATNGDFQQAVQMLNH